MRYFLIIVNLILLVSCQRGTPLFEELSPRATGIDFNNFLEESDELNVLNYTYFYNGGGVAVGDLDNDGLSDIVFTGNMVRNKIFINKGNMEFEDITTASGIADKQGWCTGVTLVDINNDGWLDIYICRSADIVPERRANLLFINNKDHTFSEQAAAYGLADPGYSTQAAFFDYDRDGDLDAVIINHSLKKYTTGVSDNPQLRTEENPFFASRLYRNDNGYFSDVSQSAGLRSNVLSFGLGVVISDFNTDGWPDFYISNDFNEPDYLFINRKDGTFSEEGATRLTQHSLYSMGVDAGDINHDGRPDLVTLDMLPESNFDQKMHSGAENFDKFRYLFSKGFHNQYSRNMLHLNMGNGQFAEIGQLAGISNTDWSWAALLKDFDNDGQTDLFVTNGYVRDYTDMDFIKYSVDRQVELRKTGGADQSLVEYIRQMPGHPLSNYLFRAKGNLQYENVAQSWGLNRVGVFSGAATGDLDQDGDLDLVLTVTNGKAVIYKNHLHDDKALGFLRFRFQGMGQNLMGLGAVVEVYSKGVLQIQEHHLTRGFQSSMEPVMHFGMGQAATADSVIVTWPDGRTQRIRDLPSGTITVVRQEEARDIAIPTIPVHPYYVAAPEKSFSVADRYQSDFTVQPALNNFLSNVSPVLAYADFDGDGKDDLVVGATRLEPTTIRTSRGRKISLPLETPCPVSALVPVDINSDGYIDLLVGRNAYSPENVPGAMLQVYLNTGGKQFRPFTEPMPPVLTNVGAIATDIHTDAGELYVFVGSRVRSNQYPLADSSRVFVFSSTGKYLREEVLPGGGNLGMVTGAVFCELDGVPGKELVTVGEFQSPAVFSRQQGQWTDRSRAFLPKALPGWWTSLMAADLDGDGDKDLLAGNYGLNTQFRARDSMPLTVHCKDFDGNGKMDIVTSYYIGGKAWPALSLDDLVDQLPFLRKRFNTYSAYAKVTAEDLFSAEERRDVLTWKAEEMRTLVFENRPGASLVIHELPIEAQFSPVFASAILDMNEDGQPDLLLCGNQSGTRIKFGKYDANSGFVFRNEGNMRFSFSPPIQSGFNLQGDVRSIVALDGGEQLYFGIHGGSVQAVRKNR